MNALVLIAEADAANARLLGEVCEATGHDVVTASNLLDASALIARRRPDLVLVDVALPSTEISEKGGIALLASLKADVDLADIPVLVTTHSDDADTRHRVFEIQQRVRNALRRVIAERRLLAIEGDELLDPLTRAGSRGQLQISLEYEMTRAARYGHDLSCISVQLSNLDHLVSQRGRETGDGLLIQLAGVLRTCIRGIDHMFRGERDEFVLLLPETSVAAAAPVVARIAARGDEATALAAPVRLSVGIAGRVESQSKQAPELLEAARAARAMRA
jgi:two-component system, cell cycle response regulator